MILGGCFEVIFCKISVKRDVEKLILSELTIASIFLNKLFIPVPFRAEM